MGWPFAAALVHFGALRGWWKVQRSSVSNGPVPKLPSESSHCAFSPFEMKS